MPSRYLNASLSTRECAFCLSRWPSAWPGVAANPCFSCRQLSAAARRTLCSPFITLLRANARFRISLECHGLLCRSSGLEDVPRARVAVLDGNAYAPGQAWKHGSLTVRTLWGELAWQLGGQDGYGLVQGADESGTSPGKEVLAELFRSHAPCVILIDELVAHMCGSSPTAEQRLSGGTYGSNISFLQALTEAGEGRAWRDSSRFAARIGDRDWGAAWRRALPSGR